MATTPSLTPYTRSKTIAERAAWELVRDAGATERLAVVNPGAIIGPALSNDRSFSLELIERLMKGAMPALPRLGFSLVDVRDVAALELLAMRSPDAGGKRLIATDQFMWMAEIAEVLRDSLGDEAAKVPTRVAPNLLIKAVSSSTRACALSPAISASGSSSPTTAPGDSAGHRARSRDSIVDTARSLQEHGVV